MNRLYVQALLFVVLPLIVALAVLLGYGRALLEEGRAARVRELGEANRQMQYALGQQTAQAAQMATLLARSREVLQAMTDRNTQQLFFRGDRFVGAGLADEIYFVSREGFVIARGHDELRFNDPFAGSLKAAGAGGDRPATGIIEEGGRLYFAARAPARLFDVQSIGYVVLMRQITPKVLASLMANPDLSADLRAGSATTRAVRAGDDTVVEDAFDLLPDVTLGRPFHVVLRLDFANEAHRLKRYELLLVGLAVFSLLVLPAIIGTLLFRLLRPVRELHRRLRKFAVQGTGAGELIAGIAALEDGRNELSAIAGSVASALKTLQATQTDLAQAQKLAALGALVAGFTHEINTPIGNSRMVASTLRERARELAAEIAAGNLRRSSLERFLAECQEATGILDASLGRTAEMIGSFKHVAVDQAGGQRRDFLLHESVHDLLITLRPTLKKLPIKVSEAIPDGIRMDSFPGALAQVLTNLVQNAVLHGLAGAPQGEIRIAARLSGDAHVAISVADDGRGIPPEHLGRIFEEFFTTQRGSGGSGLGLHISRKLVNEALGGEIAVQSTPGAGATFTLKIPRVAPFDGSVNQDDMRPAGTDTPPAGALSRAAS